jgi:hypothetical protein
MARLRRPDYLDATEGGREEGLDVAFAGAALHRHAFRAVAEEQVARHQGSRERHRLAPLLG